MSEAEDDVRSLWHYVEFCEKAARFNGTRTSRDILKDAMARLNAAIAKRDMEAMNEGYL